MRLQVRPFVRLLPAVLNPVPQRANITRTSGVNEALSFRGSPGLSHLLSYRRYFGACTAAWGKSLNRIPRFVTVRVIRTCDMAASDRRIGLSNLMMSNGDT